MSDLLQTSCRQYQTIFITINRSRRNESRGSCIIIFNQSDCWQVSPPIESNVTTSCERFYLEYELPVTDFYNNLQKFNSFSC